ncbi:hypothetical protein [Rhizobium sp. WYJ-E13]|uniref:hypothetical protein n=1 Tax=Rhizobium sp. WYJ-E13 TaxID=2849093 RepID=UPI001C1EE540|nr:hypothetical protein [Rhizobium sp. WYJ-E13]QWW72565.1 hypothetical protein KQ933_32160 [Rhizobium sp. WYJ-E13]
MTRSTLTTVMRVQVEIALASFRQDPVRLSLLEEKAGALGLTGAEIDAAKRGASFNVIADAMVKYAVGLETRDSDTANVSEERLISFGMSLAVAELAIIVNNMHLTGLA